MGSATRKALAGTHAALTALGRAELRVAEDLLAAGRVIGSSKQLRSALTDGEADAAQKRALVEAVFGIEAHRPTPSRSSPTSRRTAGPTRPTCSRASRSSASGSRPSRRATSPIDAELFAFERAVASDAELELALGSKLEPDRGQGADRRPAARGQGLAADRRDRATTSCSSRAAAASASCSATRHPSSPSSAGSTSPRSRPPSPLSAAQLDAPRAGPRGAVRPRAPGQHHRRSRRRSAGSACRSATTSSTAASPRASARCGRSLPADAG